MSRINDLMTTVSNYINVQAFTESYGKLNNYTVKFFEANSYQSATIVILVTDYFFVSLLKTVAHATTQFLQNHIANLKNEDRKALQNLHAFTSLVAGASTFYFNIYLSTAVGYQLNTIVNSIATVTTFIIVYSKLNEKSLPNSNNKQNSAPSNPTIPPKESVPPAAGEVEGNAEALKDNSTPDKRKTSVVVTSPGETVTSPFGQPEPRGE